MKISKLAVLGILALVAAVQPKARAGTFADDVIGELQQMKSVYTAQYAPTEWKKKYANYDLNTEFAKAVAAVQANPNLSSRDAREIFKNFIYAMKDYHTSISFVSTESASLPFTVKGTDTQFFIMYIDRTKLPESSFPFHVGDELVTFDGKPAAQAVAEVQAEIPANVPTTDKAIAELSLTHRTGAKGYDIPRGPITIGVIPQGSTAVTNLELVWEYTPERITPRGTHELLTRPAFATSSSRFNRPQMNVDVADAPLDNPYAIGGRETFTPALGTAIWTSADSDIFHAYVFKNTDGKLMGYLRLPSYEADDYPKAIAEFTRDIALFESTTDGLVIDEANNPGGSVFYLYALASMLSDQALSTPRHHMAITQDEVKQALDLIPKLETIQNDAQAKKALGATLGGYPVSYEVVQFFIHYEQFIIDQWNAGHHLTQPYWIAGVDHINPGPVNYTKPILLLVNNLDFSGGDFFPAIMQDNKRVTVMGTRTSGAGGYVKDITFPNLLGIQRFRVTESIAARANGQPIENLGVKPDVALEITERDLAGNYYDYVRAIQAQVKKLAP